MTFVVLALAIVILVYVYISGKGSILDEIDIVNEMHDLV